jgi:hypothetical protein
MSSVNSEGKAPALKASEPFGGSFHFLEDEGCQFLEVLKGSVLRNFETFELFATEFDLSAGVISRFGRHRFSSCMKSPGLQARLFLPLPL